MKWSIQSEAQYRIEAALKMAASHPQVAVTFKDFDTDHSKMLMACTNGVVELTTGGLREGNPTDMLTRSSNLPYLLGEPCPRWLRFLDEIFSGDEGRILYIHKLIGYCLTGSTQEQKFYILYGTGWNGKSVLMNILRKVMGDYADNTPSSTLLADPRGPKAQTNDLAALKGKRLVTAAEVNEGARLDEGRVKAMTGGDPITARFLRREFFTFYPQFKLFLAVNHKPNIWGTDVAIWRRIDLIPFTVQFNEKTADQNLQNELASEAPAILAWAVEGCLRWQREGLGHADAVSQATRDYREENDVLGAFLQERTISDLGARVQSSKLHQAYKEWADATGNKHFSNITLSKKLVERGFEKESGAHVYFLGLELRPKDD